jgi:hypothetical protein
VTKWLYVLVYVRYAVLDWINAKLTRDGLPMLTPFQWLLLQLYPEIYLGDDVFEDVTHSCIDSADISPTKLPTRKDFKDLEHVKIMGVPFIDESQVLLTTLSNRFLSGNGEQIQSAFTALLKGFSSIAKVHKKPSKGYPVFSGTGLSIDALREQSHSTMAKITGGGSHDECFIGFEPLGVDAVKEYLRVFLALDDQVGDKVLEHVAKWLRGRPRWTASFLEVYLNRIGDSDYTGTQGSFSKSEAIIVQALDRYIRVMTSDNYDSKTINRRHSWTAGDASVYAAIKKVMEKTDMFEVQSKLRQAILDFSVGGKATYFRQNTKFLIEIGVAAVSIEHSTPTLFAGVLDEPLVVQAGITYFTLVTGLTERLQEQQKDGQGQAFEQFSIRMQLTF